MLADKGGNASSAEVGLVKSCLDKRIKYLSPSLTILGKQVHKLDPIPATYLIFPMKPSTVVLYENLQVNNDIFEFFLDSAWTLGASSVNLDLEGQVISTMFAVMWQELHLRLLDKLLGQAVWRLQQQQVKVLVVLELNLGLHLEALSELMSSGSVPNLVPVNSQMILHP